CLIAAGTARSRCPVTPIRSSYGRGTGPSVDTIMGDILTSHFRQRLQTPRGPRLGWITMPAQIWSATFMRRILSLDGGGIRGIFTLQVLKQIETLFRDARSRPDLVLRDEFHLFAGTSTGAVIATCLAWGMS